MLILKYIIYDESIKFSEQLKGLILEEHPDSDVKIYNSVKRMLDDTDNSLNEIDGIFIDIKSGNSKGMEAAATLRKINPDIKLVYVRGFASETYKSAFECPIGVAPTAYIVKPYDKSFVSAVLYKLETGLSDRDEYLSIKQGRRIVFIYHRDIIAVSCDKRKLTLHTREIDIEFYGKLSEYSEKLARSFVQCHKSYLINVNHIKENDNHNTLTMSDGSTYPIGRAYRDNLST